MNFLLPRTDDARKRVFGSVPNLTNYGNFFINFECLLWYLREEYGDFFHIGYSYQVSCFAHACNIAFGSLPNLSNCGQFVIHLCCDISDENGLILFIFGTVIRYHVLLMHVK